MYSKILLFLKHCALYTTHMFLQIRSLTNLFWSSHCIDCLRIKLGLDILQDNPIYTETMLLRGEWNGGKYQTVFASDLSKWAWSKDTTDNPKSASYLNSLPELNNTRRLKSKLYDKCDDFTFPVINFQRMEFTFHSSYIILSHFPDSAHLRRLQLLYQCYVVHSLKISFQNYIWSTAQSGWPYQNIRFSNGNASFSVMYSHRLSPDLWWGPCCLFFLVFYVAFCFVLFVSVLCLLPNVICSSRLPIRDCSSIFYNVYFYY